MKPKENFENIVVVDTEFKGDQDLGQINDPVCVVFKEISRTPNKVHAFTGKKWKLPYPANKTLWIAHNVAAEAHAFLASGIKLPKYWWDTFIEDKELYFNKVQRSQHACCMCKVWNSNYFRRSKRLFVKKLFYPTKPIPKNRWIKLLSIADLMLMLLQNYF